jgi:hypothetical protein
MDTAALVADYAAWQGFPLVSPRRFRIHSINIGL